MALLALMIGAILIVAALRGTQSNLFGALKTDVPGFAVWAAAIFALGVIGFVPGLKPTSRALLVLVFVVIILKNYQAILNSFQSTWQGAPAQAAGTSTATSDPGNIGNSVLNEIGTSLFDNFGSSMGING